MGVALKAGSRYRSATCATEVVVVKGSGDSVDLRCGGSPMVPVAETPDPTPPTPPFDDGSLMGKRYVDADDTVEVLCTKPGEGSLSIGETALQVRGSKPLPASD